ncbi:MAG TPA: hypothetical protein VFG87_11970 [Amycolatopsis sp.]|nr:hypothetical protein [Amycolatopsis sp.]
MGEEVRRQHRRPATPLDGTEGDPGASSPAASRHSVTGEAQPDCPLWITPAVTSPSAAIAVTWPGRSTRRSWRGVSAMPAHPSAKLATPAGRLIRKTLRHPQASMSSPPTSGPNATAPAPVATHRR